MLITELKKIKKYDVLLILFFIACYVFVLSFYSIIRYNYFHVHAFDFGIFNQIFWNMGHNGTQINTLEASQTASKIIIEGGQFRIIPIVLPTHAILINHLGIHFSLILYLFAPIYAIFQSPKTILILQSFMIGMGALPLYLIAKEKTKSIFFHKYYVLLI